MRVAIIGAGAIATYVTQALADTDHVVTATLVRPSKAQPDKGSFGSVAALPDGLNVVIDCAGHAALRAHGPDILERGIDLVTVSIGALADAELLRTLDSAATRGGARLYLASGAIGALDCLQAAKVGNLDSVTYTGRKPPTGWKGSAAEAVVDLGSLTSGAVTHFEGSARDAALRYPKNANVAAAVAFAGIGFDATKVLLIADADVTENTHEVIAKGDFGTFDFRIYGNPLPDNPRSSALAAMSVISKIQQLTNVISL